MQRDLGMRGGFRHIATFSAAASEVLAAYFPEERPRLRYLAAEAALSRVYAGIHYRFDSEAGLGSHVVVEIPLT